MVWKNKHCCTAVLELLLEDELTVIPKWTGMFAFDLFRENYSTSWSFFFFEFFFFFFSNCQISSSSGSHVSIVIVLYDRIYLGCRSPQNPCALFPLWFDNQSFGCARNYPQRLCLWRPLWSHGILVNHVIRRQFKLLFHVNLMLPLFMLHPELQCS